MHALHGGVSCFAWRGFLLSRCVCVCVCPSIRVSVFKISQKLLNHFWGRASLWPREETIIRIWKKSPRDRGGGKSGPNDKWSERIIQVAITPKPWEIDKSYMGSPTAPLDLTLSDLERSNQISKPYILYGSLIRPYVTKTSIGNHIWGIQWHRHIWHWVTLESSKSSLTHVLDAYL